jgi:hypothetical protein
MTIRFQDMVQVNKKSKFMRRIRLYLEFKDKNGFFVYEWQNDKKWESYSAEIMVKIADAINNDQTTVSVTAENRSYNIDLGKLIQTNTSTNVTRKILCVKSSLFKSDLIGILYKRFLFDLEAKISLDTPTTSNKRPLENDDEEEEEEEELPKSTTKKRAASKSSGPEKSSGNDKRNQFSKYSVFFLQYALSLQWPVKHQLMLNVHP